MPCPARPGPKLYTGKHTVLKIEILIYHNTITTHNNNTVTALQALNFVYCCDLFNNTAVDSTPSTTF